MGSSILAFVVTPFKQPFAHYPGAFLGLAMVCFVVGSGLGRLPGAVRRRVLEKRLAEAKGQALRADAEGRRFAELLGVTSHGRAALARLSNDELRAKTQAFASALRAQLAAWRKELDGRLGVAPPPLAATGDAEERQRAWGEEAKRLLTENAGRLAAYRDRFKVDAVMLRTEIARRLERPPERSLEAVTRVPAPTGLAAMAQVASDLEDLAKLLPDDAAARAQAAERRQRQRRRSRRRQA